MPVRKPKPAKTGPKPRDAAELNSARLEIKLPPSDKARWQEAATDAGLDVAELIRAAVEAHLTRGDEARLAELGRVVLSLARDHEAKQ